MDNILVSTIIEFKSKASLVKPLLHRYDYIAWAESLDPDHQANSWIYSLLLGQKYRNESESKECGSRWHRCAG
jgi:hypothetical protein